MKAILILFSFVLLTSCAQQATRNKGLSEFKKDEKGRVLASDYVSMGREDLKRVCGRVGGYEVCYHLGNQLEKEGNLDEANKYHKLACNGEVEKACDALAARGIPAFNVNREMVYTKCDIGMLECPAFGTLIQWISGNQGTVRARRHYKKACYDNGDSQSCYYLGWLQKKEGQLGEARGSFSKSCLGEMRLGCMTLGDLEKGDRNLVGAVQYYSMGCKIDDGSNNFCLDFVSRLEKDFQKACNERGDAKACYGFANFLLREGLRKGELAYLLVYSYFDRACRKGHKKSCDLLEDLIGGGKKR